MIEKFKEKETAIKLRKRGFSYSEILKEVPVAKSTLSLWLRSVGLAKKQKQRLTEKRIIAALRGASARRNYRLISTEIIKREARSEIGRISKRELWLIGVALYWAEGHKERIKSERVQFSNSDPNMIKLFLEWLERCCKIHKKDIYFRIFLHKTAKDRLNEVQKHWLRVTGFPPRNFQKITWKRHKIKTKRRNIGENYFGLLRVIIKKSTNLNRKIQGWIVGICTHCGVV